MKNVCVCVCSRVCGLWRARVLRLRARSVRDSEILSRQHALYMRLRLALKLSSCGGSRGFGGMWAGDVGKHLGVVSKQEEKSK